MLVLVVVLPPQAAMNAARLPYPAIFRTSRRVRSMSRFSAASLSASRLRTRLASRESPIELLLPDQGHPLLADKLRWLRHSRRLQIRSNLSTGEFRFCSLLIKVDR